jgi:hypothetical protein
MAVVRARCVVPEFSWRAMPGFRQSGVPVVHENSGTYPRRLKHSGPIAHPKSCAGLPHGRPGMGGRS